MTEKNIFVYKLLFSSSISGFWFIFYIKIAPLLSLEKVTPSFPATPPLKIEVLSSPLLSENLVRGSTPLLKKKGVHTVSSTSKVKEVNSSFLKKSHSNFLKSISHLLYHL